MSMHPIRKLFSMVVLGSLLFSGCYGDPQAIVPTGPPSAGFPLGPEDVLEIVVWRNPDLSRVGVVVRPDGKISLPLIGDVQAAGVTAEHLAEEITARYKEYKENPAVSVSVSEVNSYNVFVVGEVNAPGKYPLKSYATVLQAISLAGGFSQFAAENGMQVVRSTRDEEGNIQEIRIPVQYDALLSPEGSNYNFVLHPGDTIVVP